MSSEIERVEKEDIKDEEVQNDEESGKRRSLSTLLAWWNARLDSTRGNIINHAGDDEGSCQGFSINPHENRLYRAWVKFVLLWAIYSSFFTPMEFGFFRGLPDHLQLLDILGQVVFVVDVILQFFVAYTDTNVEDMVYSRNLIALRYLKSYCIPDVLACMPWEYIYRASGREEAVRYFLLIRLVRVRKVTEFFYKLEKDIRVSYLFSRILKLIAVELYCTHTAACIFYHLATTLPANQEEYTWIGSLTLGDYSYSNFRDIDLWRKYITSLYFAIITMTTVGYGDIHPVNLREMIFVMVYVSFDMVLGAYLVGSITALVVKGSKTEIYREKIKNLLKHMDKKVDKDVQNKIKYQLQLPYDSSPTDSAIFQDLPSSIRTMITDKVYKPLIEKVPLFMGCSPEFINQIVSRVHEEFFSRGKVMMEQNGVVDHLYFIGEGKLEEVVVYEGGLKEEILELKPNDSFGDVSILCNIPQPYTVRIRERCLLLRIDKQSFSNILKIYFHDRKKILNNLLKGKEGNVHMKPMVAKIKAQIAMQEAHLALRVNSAAYNGDLFQLRDLIQAGADPNIKNFDGRSPLHLAASKGHEDIAHFLIQVGVEVNISDNFGNTPLLEAIKSGHEKIASLIINKGGSLMINDGGNIMASSAERGNPNSKDYDFRTPLHVAALRGSYGLAKLLVKAGAQVLSKDRWGKTPLDEAKLSKNERLIKLLEEAATIQLSDNTSTSQELIVTDKMMRRKCTIYPFQPWELPKDQNKYGVVLWVPDTINELIEKAADHFKLDLPSTSCILTEEAGQIIDVSRVHEEFFPPGKVIMEQGSVADQLYFISDGKLEEVVVFEGGPKEAVSILNPHDSFGDVSILCNIPEPYTVRVSERCLLLRIDKQSFSNILKIYFHDKRKILDNLLEGKESNVHMKHVVSEIKAHIELQEAELALRLNNAAYRGDLSRLKSLIRAGADPNKKNFDGRSPLHLAASKGHEDITLFLIQEGVEVNISDNFGNTPLLEAIKRGHDNIASLLIKEGCSLTITDSDTILSPSVARGVLNSKDYDFRTPLHVATARGSYALAELLVKAGASVLSKDRWGNTPLDEVRLSGNEMLINLLEEAKSSQLSEFPLSSQEPSDKKARKKCTIYPFQPWELPKDQNKYGVVLWVPDTIDELIETTVDHLKLELSPNLCVIVTADAGKIVDVDMIANGQKLYLITTQE